MSEVGVSGHAKGERGEDDMVEDDEQLGELTAVVLEQKVAGLGVAMGAAVRIPASIKRSSSRRRLRREEPSTKWADDIGKKERPTWFDGSKRILKLSCRAVQNGKRFRTSPA